MVGTELKANFIGNLRDKLNQKRMSPIANYTSSVGVNKLHGSRMSRNVARTLTSPSRVHFKLTSGLNDYEPEKDGWNKWPLNESSKTISSTINLEKTFSVNSQTTLFSNLTRSENTKLNG